MSENEFEGLCAKALTGEATETELAQLEGLLSSNANRRLHYEELLTLQKIFLAAAPGDCREEIIVPTVKQVPTTPAKSTPAQSSISVWVGEQVVWIKVLGWANLKISVDFKRLVQSLFEKGYEIFRLDLTACKLMDSTFLGVLAGLGQRLPARIQLLNPNARIMDILANLGVEHLFEVQQDTSPGADEYHVTSITDFSPSQTELARISLEAHQCLLRESPGNIPKFKEVTQFLEEDLARLKRRQPEDQGSEQPCLGESDKFEETQWGLVCQAKNDTSALEKLCQDYWRPIYAYIRRKGYAHSHAEDLTQKFFTLLMDKNALKSLSPERGRFRSWLLACCNNFLVSQYKRSREMKHGGGQKFVSIDHTA
jgi:anti-anti-sigma regulatory factor